jgi:hypothetical protein|tara:strand:- start:79 stop:288 length:210 start_codon:yes stop_codon:yes gene_type:complete
MNLEEGVLAALAQIAKHEKECGKRWAETAVELRELKEATRSHAARWEKLAWFVIATVFGCAATVLTHHL